MGQLDRHMQIAEKIAQMLEENISDPSLYKDVEVVDIVDDSLPTYGIGVSPESVSYGMGTADRDDVVYSILISRSVGAKHDEDHVDRLKFYQDVRLLFHYKRIVLDGTCHAYCVVDSAKAAIPEEWRKNNNSAINIRVNVLVRESRDKEI